jgi:hypothetical protein
MQAPDARVDFGQVYLTSQGDEARYVDIETSGVTPEADPRKSLTGSIRRLLLIKALASTDPVDASSSPVESPRA